MKTVPAHRDAGMWISRLTGGIASLKFSLATLLLLLGGLPLTTHGWVPPEVLIAVAGSAFAINLIAALWNHTAFRSQPGLLIFHASLILFLGAAIVGRLTYFKGAVEITQGETFRGNVQSVEQGPWHPNRLQHLRFSYEGLTVDYNPGLKRGPTRNVVRWQDSAGTIHGAVIGDSTPLVLEGYRFRTTANKGFALVLLWLPVGNTPPTREILHLPSYPASMEQVRYWRIPKTPIRTKTALLFDEMVVDPEKASQFHIPRFYHLKLTTGDGTAYTLKEGSQLQFKEGILVLEGLRTWMGYRIHYDSTMNWLLASCLTAIVGLAWHYHSQFSQRHWMGDLLIKPNNKNFDSKSF